jgi:hypothetical protein
MKYGFMDEQAGIFRVTTMSRVLQVSRSAGPDRRDSDVLVHLFHTAILYLVAD